MSLYWFARSQRATPLEWIALQHVDWRRVRIRLGVEPRQGMVPLPVSPQGYWIFWLAIGAMAAGAIGAIMFGREVPEQAGLLLIAWLAAVGVPTAIVMNRRCDPERTLEDYAADRKQKQMKRDLAA